MPRYILRNTSHHQSFQAAVSMAAHHDQVNWTHIQHKEDRWGSLPYYSFSFRVNVSQALRMANTFKIVLYNCNSSIVSSLGYRTIRYHRWHNCQGRMGDPQ